MPIWAIAGRNVEIQENLEKAVVKYIATAVENADISNAVIDPTAKCVSAALGVNPVSVGYTIALGLLVVLVTNLHL